MPSLRSTALVSAAESRVRVGRISSVAKWIVALAMTVNFAGRDNDTLREKEERKERIGEGV